MIGKKNVVSLSNMNKLMIQGEDGVQYYGGNQDWFSERWKQQSGCGPTSGANIFWYLAQTRNNASGLCQFDASKRDEFVSLMEDVWEYITPGNMGVNNTEIFKNGSYQYGKDREVNLIVKTLDIKQLFLAKRNYKDIQSFIIEGLKKDVPVAFLNLSNGTLQNLDSWHWVIIVAIAENEVMIYDQGKELWIDLRQWMATSIMGGGFVMVDVLKDE